MQLTRFDRWLREKYVYETHIHTLRLPESLPAGIQTREIPDVPGKRYKHLFVASRSTDADQLISQLKQDSQMYTTQIVDRNDWYVPLIAPKNKSVTWWLFSFMIISISVLFALAYVKTLVEDPVFRQSFMDALNIVRG